MTEKGIDFEQMRDMQLELQEKYGHLWTKCTPEAGKTKLLWAVAECGEVADIIKKDGDNAIMNDTEVRRHFTEELCDVIMYLNDVMLCYDIKPSEIEKEYRDKHETNMNRW